MSLVEKITVTSILFSMLPLSLAKISDELDHGKISNILYVIGSVFLVGPMIGIFITGFIHVIKIIWF